MRTALLLIAALLSSEIGAQGIEHKKRRNRETPTATVKCDLANLESRLQRLEAGLNVRINELTREVRSASRTVEQQTAAIEVYRDELRSKRHEHVAFTDRVGQADPESRALDQNSEVERQLQFITTTLRFLSEDLRSIKGNVSNLATSTDSLNDQLTLRSNIQDVFKSPQTIPSATSRPSSCQQIKENNATAQSDVYLVQPISDRQPFLAYCDMRSLGGGWLLINRRFSGIEDFHRDWHDYRGGFGNVAGEHWLGLEHIYEITANEIQELLIQLVDVNDANTYSLYSQFAIGSEDEGYPIKLLGEHRGTAPESLFYHVGSKFSTKDRDQDGWEEGSCAKSHTGGWWYKACDKANLNGRYLPGERPEEALYQPMYWSNSNGLKFASMSIRPKQ